MNEYTQPVICDGLAALGRHMQDQSARRIFAVIDPAVRSAPGVRRLIQNDRWQWRIFDQVKSNPDAAQVRAALDCLGAMSPDIWLAIGGGTTIDLMKLVTATAPPEPPEPPDRPRNDLIDVLTGRAPAARVGGQFIAVPTTAGTGSEATHFAVVYVDGSKYSVQDATLLPDVAVLDAGLTESLPPKVAAHTGLDALCQAIESLWSVHSTQQSRAWSSEALDLAWRNLPRVVHQPDANARRDMLTAAHLAGRAINISKTTAAHAMSYALTFAHGVPHGAAVALNIPALLRFNADVTDDNCADPRGPAHVRQTIEQIQTILGCASPDAARDALTDMIANVGCPTRLSQVNVTGEAQIDSLVEQVNEQRLANNPRRITATEQRTFWEQIR